MKALREAGGQQLKWIQRGWLNVSNELRSVTGVYAVLQRSASRSLPHPAEGIAADGRWVITGKRWFRGPLTVRPAGANRDIATMEVSYRRIVIAFLDSRQFYWRRKHWWSNQWSLMDSSGLLLARAQVGLLRYSGTVDIQERAMTLPELSILLLAGWYFIVDFSATMNNKPNIGLWR